MKILAFSSFGDVPTGHRLALSHPRQPNFFLSFEWFRVLFETSLHPQWRPRIYVACADDGSAQAALYCCTSADREPRTLHGMTNFYSIEYSLSVVGAGCDAVQALDCLIAHIAAERPRWHSIRLKLLSNTDAASLAMPERLQAAGFTSSRFFQYENWFLPVDGASFDTYYAGRPSQVRNTIERKSKKLRKSHSCEITIHTSPGPLLDAAVQDFTSIYSASWKQPEPFRDFIPGLARAGAEAGVLRLGVLRVDGRPAASQLWITSARRAVIYKLAYDEAFSDLGVGSVLSKELFRAAIDDDRVEEIDYGVGSETYKRDWMQTSRRLEGLEAHNLRTLLGWSLSVTDASKARLRGVRNAFARLPVAGGR